ncbi:hydroxyacylglutathione hydrolase GLO4 [Nakaseomyces bracarensis]|uniref:hydroxyacylglutathione hydrolase GLO4 n=1 Tax=Nakaseomyces bracarensis TaxID=273131 RepID=UPI003872275D
MFKRSIVKYIKRSMHVKPIKMRWETGGVNYSYLVSTQDKKQSWLIDPAEPEEVWPALGEEEKSSILAIVNTHHHYDHAGGNTQLLMNLREKVPNDKLAIIGGSEECPHVSEIPDHMQKYKLESLQVTCIRTPCHTQDSVCYYIRDPETNEQAIFTGDTLFTAGCGRFFEGTGEEMDKALNKYILQGVGEANWATTKVYPGHEYTLSNVKFVRSKIFKEVGQCPRFDELEKYSQHHEVTTGQFTIADDLQFNPFMMIDNPIVRKAVGDPEGKMHRAVVMDKLRKMKNAM